MKKANTIFWGIVLILVGVVIVLTQLDVLDFTEIFNNFDWNYLWPIVMILIGISFHVQFFAGKRHNPGILVPGGILLVYGCLFLFLRTTGWGNVGVLWPVFLLGPAFGLLELKLFSRGRQGSWIPVIVLFTLATFFLLREQFSSFAMTAAVALIVIGVIVIIIAFANKNKQSEEKKTDVHVDVE
ncbi:MAG: hypothetical protein KAQ68_04065 [Clostridiales bacterium]|nr:hypothetical protein [Clostridiales bacterium]